jgi:ATP-dependent DNA helicase RecG
MADHLQAEVFPEYKAALLHGRLKQKEGPSYSRSRGETHVLVSTTVIEVGVDVPNATVIPRARRALGCRSCINCAAASAATEAHLILLYQPPLGDGP